MSDTAPHRPQHDHAAPDASEEIAKMERHPLDLLSLLAGAVFTVIGVAALLGQPLQLTLTQLRWGVPALAIVAGVWLLVTSTRRSAA